MLVYLDTNVFLAKYAPDEPQHDEAKTNENTKVFKEAC